MHAPVGEAGQQNLGIGMSLEGIAQGGEFGLQLLEIVDFAVVRKDELTVGRHHRLVAERRQVDDRQPAVAKGDPEVRVQPYAGVIGAAMRQDIGHRLNGISQGRTVVPGIR